MATGSKKFVTDERTEKASRDRPATKRTQTYDNLSDIPTLDFDKKVAEASAKAAENATPVVSEVQVKDKVSLSDLNPVNPAAFIPQKQKEESPTLGSYLMDQLDAATDRTMSQIKDLHNKILEEVEEEAYEDGIDPIDVIKKPTSFTDDSSDASQDNDFNNKNYHWDEEGENEDDDYDEDEEYKESFRPVEGNYNVVKEEEKKDTVETMEDYKRVSNNLLEDLADEDDEYMNDNIDEHDEEEQEDIPDVPDIDQMDEESRNKVINDLKNEINQHISSNNIKLDLNKFTIKKKPLSISKIMKLTGAEINVADWVAPTAKRAISCSAVSGSEIIKMDPRNSTRNRLNTFKDIYSIIYNHVIDANKPDFESWLKTTYYYDLEHYYFCIYKATFGNNNFINRECSNSKCKNNFIADVKMDDMITYTPEDFKEEIKNIFNKDSTTKSEEITEELFQISDSFAVALRLPTIWSVTIENASLNEAFLNKYGDVLDIYSYIDEIFYIDKDDMSLISVDFKPDPNDYTKTAANKIRACYNIINSLSSDQYYILLKHIRELEQNNTHIHYQVPECECPKCHTKLEAIPVTADELLFSRHQLGIIAAT